jgi:uncharacterized membrane protein
MRDNHLRSLVKGLTWRITGTIDTVIISFLVTGRVAIAFSIGGIELLSKVLLYYSHERVWNRIKWGKHQKDHASQEST